MTAKQIEEIANEVMRRLELLLSKRRALLLINEQETNEQLISLHESLKAQEYTFTQCLLGRNVQAYPLELTVHDKVILPINAGCADIRKVIGMHDAIVVTGLRIAQLVALRKLAIEGECLSVIYEALRQGKQIYLLSRDLELCAASKSLRAEVIKLTVQLEAWGINFPQMERGSGSIIDKNLITMQDVCNLETGPLIIGSKTMVASVARDYLRDRKIEIIRR